MSDNVQQPDPFAVPCPLWQRHPVYTAHEVSADGRVRTTDRWVIHRNGRRHWHPSRELSQCEDSYGYKAVALGGYGSPQSSIRVRVHVLVCETYSGLKPSPGDHVRHLNGDRQDNRIENLAWGSPTENQLDSVRHGTHPHARKTQCPRGHEYTPENTPSAVFVVTAEPSGNAASVTRTFTGIGCDASVQPEGNHADG